MSIESDHKHSKEFGKEVWKEHFQNTMWKGTSVWMLRGWKAIGWNKKMITDTPCLGEWLGATRVHSTTSVSQTQGVFQWMKW